jgi:hypothetical protein
MSRYLWDLVAPLSARWYGVQDVWLNAIRRTRWRKNPKGGRRPAYRPARGLLSWLLSKEPLSRSATLRALVARHDLRIDALRKLQLPQRRQPPDLSGRPLQKNRLMSHSRRISGALVQSVRRLSHPSVRRNTREPRVIHATLQKYPAGLSLGDRSRSHLSRSELRKVWLMHHRVQPPTSASTFEEVGTDEQGGLT